MLLRGRHKFAQSVRGIKALTLKIPKLCKLYNTTPPLEDLSDPDDVVYWIDVPSSLYMIEDAEDDPSLPSLTLTLDTPIKTWSFFYRDARNFELENDIGYIPLTPPSWHSHRNPMTMFNDGLSDSLFSDRSVVQIHSSASSRDEAIWQELCRRYGDNEPADFGDTSYHRIYTLLLHPYGSLLGLWASDHPFKGGVIEFRVDPEYKGIVGEVWRFWPRHLLDNDDEEQPPKLPEYFAFASITLPKMEDRSQRAVLSWHVTGTEQGEYFGPDTASIHVPTLHVLSETCQSAFLAYSTGSTNPEPVRSSPHPDFPSPDADAWYDYTRELPHLKRVPSPISLGGKDFIKAAPRAFIYSDATSVVKPAALTIRPSYRSGGHPLACHEAPVPLPDVRNQHSSDPLGWFHRRYYPLRSLIQVGQEPSDDDWHPRSLEGLWLGSYGPHGTEILFLEYDEVMREVRAWKITGDMNVPRGAQTWNIRLSDAVTADSLAPTHPFKDIQRSRMFQGTGTICSRGFMYVFCVIRKTFTEIFDFQF
ncbi:hypothetical protein PHLCEN_2v9206 [Hermanssonia centrifuga]|uniref:Uncharacterized protein n=1 Tax=Hermanssonia centrifuga TaxID=98765 RepID=A0A2R6NRI4_9APHY|nr:hypothetical protein PHLCEN_2v9206 [Hermanssonia centrifuga]